MIDVTVTITSTEVDHALSYTAADSLTDDVSNHFKGHIRNNAASAYVMLTMYGASGAVVNTWRLKHPNTAFKADSFSIDHDRGNLVVDVYWHGPTQANGSRNTDTTHAIIPGVYVYAL